MTANGDRQIPRVPRGLGAAGRVVWREVWELPSVAPSDRLSVELLARAADEVQGLRDVLAEDGPTLKRVIQSARGDVIGEESYQHPAIAALRQLGREVASLSACLGLTPASRRALGLDLPRPVQEGPDALDQLRARREARLARQAEARGALS